MACVTHNRFGVGTLTAAACLLPACAPGTTLPDDTDCDITDVIVTEATHTLGWWITDHPVARAGEVAVDAVGDDGASWSLRMAWSSGTAAVHEVTNACIGSTGSGWYRVDAAVTVADDEGVFCTLTAPVYYEAAATLAAGSAGFSTAVVATECWLPGATRPAGEDLAGTASARWSSGGVSDFSLGVTTAGQATGETDRADVIWSLSLAER